ncbi:MAG: hypothetical protein U1U88_000606 [Lawsonella clevelandensis]
MMASKNPGGTISEEDIADLEHDVTSQLEELTNLVTDLVDLARRTLTTRWLSPSICAVVGWRH